jgi:hypothetical protein
MKGRMPVAIAAVFGSLAVALVLGTQFLKGDPDGASVVTVLGMLGLAVSQLLNNADTQEAKEQTEQLNKDLRNGTFERLLREALDKLAKENGVPLEIKDNQGKEEGSDGR